MAKRILIRRDTTDMWESVNPILSNGELGIEIRTDGTRSVKLGTGVLPWNKLEYFLDDLAKATDLSTETTDRQNADSNLQDNINTVSTALTTETNNRTNADSDLQDNINTVCTDLATETTNRINADLDLQDNINTVSTDLATETTDRQNADSNLQDNINTVSTDLATETTNRQTADSDLQDNIDTVSTDLATETTNRQTADSDLQDNIDTVSTDLATETTNRQTAVSDAINTAASDATDKADTAESNAKGYADGLALSTQKWLPAVETFDELPANPGSGTYLCRVITGDNYGVYQWIGTEDNPQWNFFSDNLDFIDRIANPITDNIPKIMANGELTDSGKSIEDILEVVEGWLDTKEDTISSGTSLQYWRGDKTWENFPSIPDPANNAVLTVQKNSTTIDTFSANADTDKTINITIEKSDVGLGNVDNTSDEDKPISTAVQDALDSKEPSKYIAVDETSAQTYSTSNPTVMVFYPEI
jgi:hypothetical protein